MTELVLGDGKTSVANFEELLEDNTTVHGIALEPALGTGVIGQPVPDRRAGTAVEVWHPDAIVLKFTNPSSVEVLIQALQQTQRELRGEICTSCHGLSTIIDPLTGQLEAYTCPDCGGSGLAADMIERGGDDG